MLIRFFKGTSPAVIFFIIVIFLAVWVSAFLYPISDSVFYYETEPMPLYRLLKQVIGNNPYLGVIFSFSTVSLMAFLLVYFNTNFFFISERTFLPAFIYILYGGLFPQYQLLNPVLPASLLLFLAIKRIIDGYRNPETAYNLFDAGILISTGSLFYANLIWFGLLLIIGIALLRTSNIIEIGISILGLTTPYILAFGLYYVIGYDLKALLSLMADNLFGRSEGYLFPRMTIVTLIFVAMIMLVSIVYLFMLMSTKKIKSRKTFSLLLWVFFISIGVYFFLPSVSVELIWIMSIPASYFLTHYFMFVKKKLVPEIFFSLFFIFVLLIQIWYLKR